MDWVLLAILFMVFVVIIQNALCLSSTGLSDLFVILPHQNARTDSEYDMYHASNLVPFLPHIIPWISNLLQINLALH